MNATAEELKKRLEQEQEELRILEADLPAVKDMMNEARAKSLKAKKKGVDDRVELKARFLTLQNLYEEQLQLVEQQRATVAAAQRAHEEQLELERRIATFQGAQQQVSNTHVTLSQALVLLARAYREYGRIRGELNAGRVFIPVAGGYTKVDKGIRDALPDDQEGISILDERIHSVFNQIPRIAGLLREAPGNEDAVRHLDEAGL